MLMLLQSIRLAAPMLAKAWAKLSYNQDWDDASGTLTVNASFNLGTPTHNFASLAED